MRLVRLLDDPPMIRQRRHLRPWAHAGHAEGRMRPVRLEVELLVGMREAVEVMRGAKIRLYVAPQIRLQAFDIAAAALLEGHVGQFARTDLAAAICPLT